MAELIKNFKTIGNWIIDNNYKSDKILADLKLSGINFLIDKKYLTFKNVIYLFKTESQILYIGETSAGMQSRFQSYRYGFDKINDTDNRVKIALTRLLEKGERIDILYCQPQTKYKFGGEELCIPLSKPIEEYLISKLSPSLNEKKLL